MITKLHLGSGGKRIPDYINVDLRDMPGIDVSGVDVTNLSSYSDDSVDAIYACHVLEHIPRPKTFRTLLEWNRVLRPGGMLRVAVPDWDATVEIYRRTGDYENLLNWIYGGREYDENTHYRQFTYHGLKSLLIEAGFKRVSQYDWRDTEHAEIDDFSKAYMPHMDQENGVLMSLNIECIKHLHPPSFE